MLSNFWTRMQQSQRKRIRSEDVLFEHVREQIFLSHYICQVAPRNVQSEVIAVHILGSAHCSFDIHSISTFSTSECIEVDTPAHLKRVADW